jgi:Na+/H+ antiporter NhaD/arsenite permease-like protein
MEVDAAAHATIFGLDPLWLSTAILILSYAAIMSERINRAIVALVGAGVVIVTGLLDQDQAIAGIDFNTIALLTGMMLLVAISKRSGMFQYVAIWSAKVARGRPWLMLALLALVTAFASALLDNVTTVLLIAPVTLVITEQLKVPAYPFLFAEIFASNIGGTATLIGDPPNILIGSATGLTFNDFLVNLAPVILLILLMQLGINHLIWGRKMRVDETDRARVMGFRPVEAINDRPLLWKSLFVLGLVIAGFILAHQLHLEPGSIALLGAALLLLLENFGRPAAKQSHGVHQTIGEVEWITIVYFIGLFVIVTGVEHAGLLSLLADALIGVTGGDLTVTTLAILWASAILSALIDNIPFVATMIPVIKNMASTFGGTEGLLPLWWALSLGACLGGNGTLIGASANLTVAGIGERAGVPFRFVPFLLLAFPMMLMSILVSTAYVYLRYL